MLAYNARLSLDEECPGTHLHLLFLDTWFAGILHLNISCATLYADQAIGSSGTQGSVNLVCVLRLALSLIVLRLMETRKSTRGIATAVESKLDKCNIESKGLIEAPVSHPYKSTFETVLNISRS